MPRICGLFRKVTALGPGAQPSTEMERLRDAGSERTHGDAGKGAKEAARPLSGAKARATERHSPARGTGKSEVPKRSFKKDARESRILHGLLLEGVSLV